MQIVHSDRRSGRLVRLIEALQNSRYGLRRRAEDFGSGLHISRRDTTDSGDSGRQIVGDDGRQGIEALGVLVDLGMINPVIGNQLL